MTISITATGLRMKTSQLLNTTVENPTAALFTTSPFNRSDVYAIQSIRTNTFGCLIPVPTALSVNNRAVYWYTQLQTNNMKLLNMVAQAGVFGKLFLVHNDGVTYSPAAETDFTTAAVTGGIYFHFKADSTGYWNVIVTDDTGATWDTTASAFSGPSSFTADAYLSVAFSNSATATLPYSTPAIGTVWTPGLDDTLVDSSGTASQVTLPIELVSTAAEITANKTTVNNGHVVTQDLEYKVYITADTHEVIFPLPSRALLAQILETGIINYLPIKFGAFSPSTGAFLPVMVKITPVTQADKDYIDDIAVNYTEITVGIAHDQLVTANGFTAANPSIIVDKVVQGYLGYFSSAVESIDTIYGRPAYLVDPGVDTFPIMTTRMVKLPYARAQLPQFPVGSAPGFETYFTGGNSLSASQSPTEYTFPVKNQFGWSGVYKVADLTDVGVDSYRMTFYPSSPIAPATLKASTASMSMKVGMYGCDPRNISTRYRVPGYAPDLHSGEWAEFYFMELSKVADTITVTKYMPSANSPPFLASSETNANISGQQIDWNGSTQVDMIVTKLTATTATLTVYLNRYIAATFSVPWIAEGSLVWFATNSGSYTDTTPMFTLSTPTEVINQPYPYNGLLVPPPPTIHEYVEITVEEVTQAPTTGNVDPFVIYVHNKGSAVDLYLPLLQAPNTYEPYRYAIIRNFPYTSGAVYDLLVDNQWHSGQQNHSFIIDTTDTLQFPSSVAYPNQGVLFSHLPPTDPTFQVSLYSGLNWTNSLGTYTAEILPSMTTYVINPYPRLGGDNLERALTASQISSGVTVTGNSDVTMSTGAALSMAFSAMSDSTWTFSFTRSSVGMYVNGYFDVILSSVRKQHWFEYNPTDGLLDLRPMPHKPSIRIRFGEDATLYPAVQLSQPIKFSYQSEMPLTTGETLSQFDGTKQIQVTLEKIGSSCMLYIHEDGRFIASTPVPTTWFYSGSITLAHDNDIDSTEAIGHMQLVSGKPWLSHVDTRPLLMTPVVNRSAQLMLQENADTTVFLLDDDCRYAYVDIYVRNPSATLQYVTVTIGGVAPMFLANKKPLPAGATLVLRSKHISPGEHISVSATVAAFARVAAVCELL